MTPPVTSVPSTDTSASDVSDTTSWQFASLLFQDLIASGQAHVPTQVMLDYAFGGLDDELLGGLYGHHLANCQSCQRAVEVYRRERPIDAADLAQVPEFAHFPPQETTYKLSPDEAGERLRNFIEAGSGELLIVAGEANPAVYDHKFAEVVKQRSLASQRAGQPIPHIICGPAMGLNSKISDPAHVVLPALAEEGLVELSIARHRQKLHFRVSRDGRVYTEKYHVAGNAGDRHGFWYRSQPIANLFRRRFDAILSAGLARPAKRSDFVYLTMDAIGRLQDRIRDRFDLMTAEELRAEA